LAKAVADILQKRLDPHGATTLPAVFPNLFDPAKLYSCEPTGFSFLNAGANLVPDLRFEVEAQLFVQLGFQSFAGEESL
jgi:hypothetical protein